MTDFRDLAEVADRVLAAACAPTTAGQARRCSTGWGKAYLAGGPLGMVACMARWKAGRAAMRCIQSFRCG